MHIHETVSEGDSQYPHQCSKPGCVAPCLLYKVKALGPTSQALTCPCQTLLTFPACSPNTPLYFPTYLQTFPQVMPLCLPGIPFLGISSANGTHTQTHTHTRPHTRTLVGCVAWSDRCAFWLPGGGDSSVTLLLDVSVKEGST